jgi:hypothetical protein
MTAMLSHMKVFNDFVMPATIETLAQMIEKFNAASAGAIRLSSEGFTGDFFQESFFAALSAAGRRVDRYASNTDAPRTDLTELQHSTVKVAGGFGPIVYEPSQMSWLERPTVQGVEVASRFFAQLMLKDMLNTGIMAAVAALENQATVKNDVSAVSPAQAITYSALNGAHAKFGDSSDSIVANVMTGAVAHRLIGQNLTNAERLFQAGNVTVIDILNKAAVITDAPALYETVSGGSDLEKVLTLADGAITVHDASDIVTNIQTDNGKIRIETTIQMDYSFGLGLKGYTWDETYGGASPTDEDLATGSNWDLVASDIKHSAGTIAIGDATL